MSHTRYSFSSTARRPPALSQFGHGAVKLDVFARGDLPGIVRAHPVRLQPRPDVGLGVTVERLVYFIKHRAGPVGAELEARAGAADAVEVLDRVVQPARRAHHRNCAITQAVHLVQPARLEERRHQENVRAGLYAVRQRLVEALVNPDASRRVVAQALQEIFVLARARAQCDEERARVQHGPGGLFNQVVALLARQPGDVRDYGPAQFLRQHELAEQRQLAGPLAFEIVRVVVRGQVRVRRGVPDVVIDPVRYPDEPVAAHAQEPVQAVAVLVRLNLLRVARADGRERVGRHQASLQGGGRAVHHEGVALLEAETQNPQVAGVERALVGEVVNRKERPRPRVERVVAAALCQFRGGEAAGPVVDVNHVGRRAEPPQERQRGAAEEGEAQVVVPEAVDRVPGEKLGRVNQERGRAGRFGIEDAGAVLAPAPAHVQVVNDLFAQVLALNLLEERQEEHGVLADLDERFRERAGNVRQTARFGERHGFRRQYRYAQDSSPTAPVPQGASTLKIKLAERCAGY